MLKTFQCSDPVLSLAYSPSGTELALGKLAVVVKGGSTTAIVWNIDNNKTRTLTGHRDYVRVVAYSNDGRWLATGSYDSTIRIYNVRRDYALHMRLQGHRQGVTSLTFAP